MRTERTFLLKTLLTQSALERHFPSMYQHMPRQMVRPRKRLFTHLGLVWLLPSMSEHMTCQILTLCKRLFTYLTFVWLLTSMSELMACQIARPIKRLFTHIALVWFLLLCAYVCGDEVRWVSCNFSHITGICITFYVPLVWKQCP